MDINPQQFSLNISRLRRQIKESRPTMKKIAVDMKTNTDIRFRETKDETGKSWKRLSYTTIKRRIKGNSINDGITKPLNDTGILKNSINYRFGSKFAVVGTNLKYAAVHQFGARKGQFGQDAKGNPLPFGDIPARKYLGFSNSQKKKYTKMILKLYERR